MNAGVLVRLELVKEVVLNVGFQCEPFLSPNFVRPPTGCDIRHIRHAPTSLLGPSPPAEVASVRRIQLLCGIAGRTPLKKKTNTLVV